MEKIQEEIRSRALADGKHSAEEINNMINLAHVLASKSVLTVLEYTIQNYCERHMGGDDVTSITKQLAAANIGENRVLYTPTITAAHFSAINIKKFHKRIRPAINKLESIKASYSGYTDIEFDDTTDKLHIGLTIAPIGYKPEIMLPEGYDQELYKQYDFLKKCAQAYWKQFAITQKDLFQTICDFCVKLDLSELVLSNDNISMYFDESIPVRVSLIPYWVDVNGKPYTAKTTKK